MNDRGMIKWEPFNSVVPASTMIKNIMVSKNKIPRPSLSSDQIKEIEESILDAFNLNIEAKILYYENGYIRNIEDKIKKIDITMKKVYLEHKVIYFSQIVRVS